MLFWGRCLIDKAAAFSFYTRRSRLRNLIHKMKYSGMKEIGYELGHIYGLSLRDTGFTDGMDIIIPVPLHPAKKRARGFNQSDYISAGISDATGIPVNITGMERVVLSVTQTNKGRFDRWANVEGIFRVTDPESLEGKHILLIDDVITTGSTLESCAGELLKVKGVKVSIAALGCAVI
jgi:ComF family protein